MNSEMSVDTNSKNNILSPPPGLGDDPNSMASGGVSENIPNNQPSSNTAIPWTSYVMRDATFKYPPPPQTSPPVYNGQSSVQYGQPTYIQYDPSQSNQQLNQTDKLCGLIEQLNTRLFCIEQNVTKLTPMERDLSSVSSDISDLKSVNTGIIDRFSLVEEFCDSHSNALDEYNNTRDCLKKDINLLKSENVNLKSSIAEIVNENNQLKEIFLELV